MGNRTAKTDSLLGNESFPNDAGDPAYDGANRLLKQVVNGVTYRFQNDADGNTLSNDTTSARPNNEGRRVSTFDAQNRMVACTYTGRDASGAMKTWASEFTYGPDGLRRYAKSTNQTDQAVTTTSSMLDGQSVVREVIDAPGTSNDETVTYLTGANGPVYRRGGSGAKVWYAYDGLGSVLGEISGSTGSLAKARVYDAYGTVRADDNTASASKHRYVGALGHPSETETGLLYMRARYMDPATGRFVSEDPAFHGGNWFVYCNNDPVNLYDPNGNEPLISQQWAIDKLGEVLKDLGLLLMTMGRASAERAAAKMVAALAGTLAAEGVLPGPLKALAIAAGQRAQALAGRATINGVAQFAAGYMMLQVGVVLMNLDDASWVETMLDIPSPL